MSRKLAPVLLVAFALVGVMACGGSGGDGGASIDPRTIVQGSYSVSVTDHTNSSYCSDSNGAVDFFPATLTVSGDSFTVTIDGTPYSGSIVGNDVVVSTPIGPYPEDGGQTTITSFTLRATSTTRMTGSSSWTWTDGFGNCSGTSDWVATKN